MELGAGRREVPRAAVRAAFALALLVLPVQHVVNSLASEPYPGLYQPSFGGRPPAGGVAVTVQPEVVVTDADGSRRTVRYQDLLPETLVLPPVVFQTAFLRGDDADDPETVGWLRDRAASLAPGADPTAVRIEWREVEHDLGSPDSRVLGTVEVVDIDLAGAR